MSGGSWDYAHRRVRAMADELRSGYENQHRLPPGDVDEAAFVQHPLRLELANHMDDLADVLRSIEWSDSGDHDEDYWMTMTEEYLRRLPADAPLRDADSFPD